MDGVRLGGLGRQGIYLRGVPGLRATINGKPNPAYERLARAKPDERDRRGLRLVDLAKRTYHGDTFARGYYAPLRAIFGGTPAANANCSGTFDGRVNDVLRKAGTKLGEGDIGVEQPGH